MLTGALARCAASGRAVAIGGHRYDGGDALSGLDSPDAAKDPTLDPVHRACGRLDSQMGKVEAVLNKDGFDLCVPERVADKRHAFNYIGPVFAARGTVGRQKAKTLNRRAAEAQKASAGHDA
jgi:hypothetical protein